MSIRKALNWLTARKFDEAQHERDKDGKFTSGGGDTFHKDDFAGIQKAALSGVSKIWIKDGKKEGLILASKQGKIWWERATEKDLPRITVW